MNVICLEDQAFYSLVEIVVARLKDSLNTKEDRWISGEEAMKMLVSQAKPLFKNLGMKGKIRFSQPEKKIILYDVHSIEEYLNTNTR